MTEPFFFDRGGGLTVREIAALTQAEPHSGADLDRRITGVASLERAARGDLVFLEKPKYAPQLTASDAGACLTTERLDAPLIVVATDSGRTALAMSNRRPTATILALTRTERVARALALCWGVRPTVAPEGLQPEQELPFAIDWALGRNLVRSGHPVVLLRGEMPGQVRHRAVTACTVP